MEEFQPPQGALEVDLVPLGNPLVGSPQDIGYPYRKLNIHPATVLGVRYMQIGLEFQQ